MTGPVAILAFIALSGAAPADEVESWPLETGSDAATYESVVSISQSSQASIQDEYATKEVFPRFILQCTPGQESGLHVKIDWQRFISSFNTDISFKADDRDRMWLKFGVDNSNMVTAAKTSDDSNALVAYLSEGEMLKVGVTPYSESAVSVTFKLTGLVEAVTALRSECDG